MIHANRFRTRGVTMVEVLITIVILTIGLLGVAGLQARMQLAEVESYHRSHAIVLLQDIIDRIAANRRNAMNYVTGGPSGKRLTDIPNGSSNVVIVWDHGRTPGCANSTIAAPRGPWQQAGGGFVLDADTTHFPVRRHEGVFNILFCDGHVQTIRQTDLLTPLFYTAGP